MPHDELVNIVSHGEAKSVLKQSTESNVGLNQLLHLRDKDRHVIQLRQLTPSKTSYNSLDQSSFMDADESGRSSKFRTVAEKVGNTLGTGLSAFFALSRDMVTKTFMPNPRDQERDLQWFEKQVSTRGLQSKAYFEKYLIVGADTLKVREMSNLGQDYAQLTP